MADKVTYDSEMNQAAHRPGQESAVNRGAQHAVPSEGDERHHVSPPTRSAFGADSDSDPAPTSQKAAPTPSPADGSGTGGRQRETNIMGQVDKAVSG